MSDVEGWEARTAARARQRGEDWASVQARWQLVQQREWDRERAAAELARQTAMAALRKAGAGRLHAGYGFTEPCEGPGCWYCGDGWRWARWDHGPWQALAATLAQPLRSAFERHLDEHGCGAGSGPTYIGGFSRCPDARALYELLPDGDRICIA